MRIASKKEIMQKYTSIMRGEMQGELNPSIADQVKCADRLFEIVSNENNKEGKSVVIIDDITDKRLESITKKLVRQSEE